MSNHTNKAVLLFAAVVMMATVLALPPPGRNLTPGKPENVRQVGRLLSAQNRGKFRAPEDTDAVVEDEYVVEFTQSTSAQKVTQMARKLTSQGVQLTYIGDTELGWRGLTFQAPSSDAANTAALLDTLLSDPATTSAGANTIFTINQCTTTPGAIGSTPDTVQPSATWGLDRIDNPNLPLNQNYGYSGSGAGVNVFVLDTGVLMTHPEFEGRAQFAYDALGGDGVDCHGHGTHCAGTIGSKTYGVAKGVNIWSARVLDCGGSGSNAGIVAAIDFVVNHPTSNKIISMSLGGGYSSSLNNAVNNAANRGVLVVVAGGNSNQDACNFSPASAANAVTVGATTSSDARASYSNYGKCIDIWAPGSSITSTWLNDGINTISGTSMATPHVAGAAARLWAKGVCTSATDCTNKLKCLAATNKVTGLPTGKRVSASPNLLLNIPPGV